MIDVSLMKIKMAEMQMRQSELCEKTGLSPYTIYMTLTGRSKPSLPTIGKLALALDIPVEQLIKED